MIFLILLSAAIGIVWTIPLVILHPFGIQLYKLTQNSEVTKILKKLNPNATIDADGNPEGFIYGRWYCGFVYVVDNDRSFRKDLYLLITTHYFKKLKNNTDNSETKNKTIDYYSREGPHYRIAYTLRSLNAKGLKNPYIFQKKIISEIRTNMKIRNMTSGVYYFHGDSGTGKSATAIFLAKEINASYCRSWNPTNPNDSLHSIHLKMKPSEKKPLVLVLEEFDKKIIDRLGKIKPHKHTIIPVKDKTDWNTMLEEIHLGIYEHTILILTSNKGPKEITDDKSLLRKGRVSKKFNFNGH